MGSCSCKESKSSSNDYIFHALLQEENKQRYKKILLLGTEGCGKTALFNSLHFIHGVGIDYEKANHYASAIHSNLIKGIMQLLSHSNIFNKLNKYDDRYIEIQTHISKISKFVPKNDTLENILENVGVKERESLADSLKYIWNLDVIQSTYKYRYRLTEKYEHIDNLDFFFESHDMRQLMESSFVTAEKDIVCTRIPTARINEFDCEIHGIVFKFMDMGGSRLSREQQWYETFEKVNCVIFCAALNDYCKISTEYGGNMNAMIESLQVFDAICNHQRFKKAELLLFLTKPDLFKQCLKHVPLTCCFPGQITESLIIFWLKTSVKKMDVSLVSDVYGLIVKYSRDVIHNGWIDCLEDYYIEHEYEQWLQEYVHNSTDYIQRKYEEQNRNMYKRIYIHVVNITDKDELTKVMWDFQNILIGTSLKRGDLV